MPRKKAVWDTREWAAGVYIEGTSDRCSSHPAYDPKKCYDPTTHQVHPCAKGSCPLAYDEKKDGDKADKKQGKLF